MYRQTTIYDFLQAEELDLSSITEAEMVEIIRSRTGIDFKYNSLFEQWEAELSKANKKKLSVHFDNYAVGNNERFISCGYDFKHGGGGSPIDSIEGAIAFFNHKVSTLTSAPLDW